MQYAVIDCVFKLLAWVAFCDLLAVSPVTCMPSAAGLILLVVLIAVWQVGANLLFVPIDRCDRTNVESVRRAHAAAQGAPARFAALVAAQFGASFAVAASVPLRELSVALRSQAGIATAIMVAALLVGGFILAYAYASWVLAPVRARLSLATGGPPPRRRSTSIRWGTAGIALGVALSPSLWMMSFSYMNDATAKFQLARGWARVAAQQLARGVAPSAPDATVVGVSFVVSGGAAVVRRAAGGLEAPPSALVAAALPALAAGDHAELSDDEGTTVVLVRTADTVFGAAARGGGGSSMARALTVYMAAVALFAVLCALLLSSTIVRSMSRLAATLRTIAARGELAEVGRIPVLRNDEVGELMVSANGMIARLEAAHAENREAAESLRLANARLEQRVAERTAALSSSNRELGDNLRHLKHTQSELADVARRLGMAEVASSVLHNVGNVLNSVNVSVGLIADKLRASHVPALQRGLQLAAAQPDLAAFLTADPRGKLLPSFVARVATAMGEDHAELTRELRFLEKNVEHIKSVVTRQQAHARPAGGLVERVGLTELVDDAARFALADADDVIVAREHPAGAELAVDRHHVFQILVNLLRNARDAVLARPRGEQRIVLRTVVGEDDVAIEVEDNGAGIAPEHRARLFEMGFTTKPTGHGYGLHSSALAARALGGTLTAHSDGPGQGSRFRLTLPRTVSAVAAA